MTIYVPSDGRGLLSGTPVKGSVDEIDAVAEFVADVVEDVTFYAADVRNASLNLGGLDSRAVQRIDAKISGNLVTGAAELESSASSAKSALENYAAEVSRIHNDADNVEQDIDEAVSTIRSRATEIEDIASTIRVPAPYVWNVGAPTTMPDPQPGPQAPDMDAAQAARAMEHTRMVYENQWLNAAQLWHLAIEEVESAKSSWARLIEERRAAERSLTGSLEDTAIGQLLSISGGGIAEQQFTISMGVAGELWGAGGKVPELRKSHPLLDGLLGDASGADLWDDPPPPSEVAQFWEGLTEDERNRLIDEAPWVIGNLPGLPFGVRDQANRKLVEFYQQYPQSLSPEQMKLMSDICEILDREAAQAIPDPPIQLVAFDMTGEVPKVAVSYGDLDTASHTTWQVPGMNSDAHLALEGWDQASLNLYLEQRDVPRFNGSNAVVTWLGYDTPNLPTEGDFGVLSSDAAAAGALRFASELDGAHAARSSGEHGIPYTGVLAHSYGTTLATIALTLINPSNPVDSLTMLGSAGLDTDLVPSYDVLHVKEVSPGQQAIYTTHASGDKLAPLGAGASGRGQPNPDARDALGLSNFSPVYGGGLSFPSDGDFSLGLKRTDGHSTIGEGSKPGPMGTSASAGHGYLDVETQSLTSVAQISVDQIGGDLQGSLVRTEQECVELVVSGGSLIPVRTECEDSK